MSRLSAVLVAAGLVAPAHAVIILDSTYKAEGYDAAEALAAQPQFDAVFAFCEGIDEGCGNASGTWIGNDESHGYILTAAHNFDGGYGVGTWAYRSKEGRYYTADAVAIHPNYTRVVATDEANEISLGFDIAIVTLSEPVTDAGAQPMLYSGEDEFGQTLTYVGYGSRGTAGAGEDQNVAAGTLAAAAQGVVDFVEPLELSAAGGADGNFISVFLPREDGSVESPFTAETGLKPISKYAGLLGSGDSGGSAWIDAGDGWAIAGINGNGSGNAQYGDTSGFARVSGHIAWITGIFPGAKTE